MIDERQIRERLLGRVQKDPATGCWIYTGAWSEKGHARMRVGDRVYWIQDVAAWLFKGFPLWKEGVRYRTCHTPACCNPAHIKVATTMVEALKDMRRRRLFPKPKISEAGRRCVQFLLENGTPPTEIAADLKCSVSTVLRVKRGRHRDSSSTG